MAAIPNGRGSLRRRGSKVNGTRHREVDAYLERLRRSLAGLPEDRRAEIVAEIEGHISEALAERPDATDAVVRSVLERVGDPADIAAEARARFGIEPAPRRWTDPLAIVLLLVGGFTIVGWFAGVVLLWISEAWNGRDKVIGTLVVPGGLAGSLGIGLIGVRVDSCQVGPVGGPTGACTPEPSTLATAFFFVLGVLVVIAPIATAIYLSRRLRRARLGAA
jgi:hypothetical protein